jgi:hypothetical protein
VLNRGGALDPAASRAAAAALRWALRFMPLVMPEEWAGRRLCDSLPEYAAHADPAVRSEAAQAALRCVTAVPEMRAGLVRGDRG